MWCFFRNNKVPVRYTSAYSHKKRCEYDSWTLWSLTAGMLPFIQQSEATINDLFAKFLIAS